MGLGLVLATALSGTDAALARWLAGRAADPRTITIRSNLSDPGQAAKGQTVAGSNDTPMAAPASDPNSGLASGRPVARWPAVLWLWGTVCVGVGLLAPRWVLVRVWFRAPGAVPVGSVERVMRLARRLGLSRRVRLVECSRLAGPVAFGVLHPTVGLPPDFWTAHTESEQEAMLAHELAHLARQDPLWHTAADVVAACLWWHPMVWWGRRQLRAASESAADEASLVVENGPTLLAGCLVALASRLKQRGVLGLLGMAGFRSDLGRRVERLLGLVPGAPGREVGRGRRWWVAAGMSAALGLALFAPAWLVSGQADPPATLLALMRDTLPRSGNAITNASGVQVAAGLDASSAGTKAVVQATAATGQAGTTNSAGGADVAAAVSATGPGSGVFPGSVSGVPPLKGEGGVASRVTAEPVLPVGLGAGGTAAQSTTNALYTRTFKVNFQRLEENLPALMGSASKPPVEGLEILRQHLEAAGVVWGGSNLLPALSGSPGPMVGFQSGTGKALFMNRNPSPGVLLVRGTLADLDVVETYLEAFGQAPPQVLIEARLVEITMDAASMNLGVDWLQGTVPASTSTNGPAVFPGIQPAAQGVTGLGNDPKPRGLAVAPVAGTTNNVREYRGDELDWPGRQGTNAHDIRIEAALGYSLMGLLTDVQLRMVLRALETRPGVDFLSAPKLTTLSGRQAQIQVGTLQTLLTAVNPEALVRSGARPAVEVPVFTSSTVPTGATVDLQPTVSADGWTIRLNIIVTLSEFLGYDPAPKDSRVRVWDRGKQKWVLPPLPRLRVRQMTTEAVVADGQTLVLGGMPVEETSKDRQGKGSKGGATVRKQILVLLTPTLIDPAGNRIHPVDNPTAAPAAGAGSAKP
jgi:type II secretory pathway component GspD/PulD (secretin)